MRIDTDRYAGHTEGTWAWERGELRVLHVKDSEPMHTLLHDEKKDVDAQLIADAPLLLEEVKRLREGRLDLINEVVRIINNKTGERVDADLHDYIIDRLVNE